MNKTVKFLQKMVFHAINSRDSKNPPTKATLPDGRVLLNDICYSDQYPNSFLDLYLSPTEMENHPTFLYVHGGGYTWGKKEDYEVCSSNKGLGFFFSKLSKLGWNIVSIDYAFAPEYGYPTPLRQITKAVEYLKTNVELNLDLSRVAFGGDSAGGQLIGQFINIQTNDDYAREMGMPQILPKGAIRSAVFFSGLLDPERFGVTHTPVIDKLFSKCGYAYFQTQKLEGHKDCIQADVIRHATTVFPPSFISDGNNGSFYDQAGDFSKKLSELGVANELLLFSTETAMLAHGYETADSPQAIQAKEHAAAFVQDHLK